MNEDIKELQNKIEQLYEERLKLLNLIVNNELVFNTIQLFGDEIKTEIERQLKQQLTREEQ